MRLPAPRGPISDRVIAVLRQGAGAARRPGKPSLRRGFCLKAQSEEQRADGGQIVKSFCAAMWRGTIGVLGAMRRA